MIIGVKQIEDLIDKMKEAQDDLDNSVNSYIRENRQVHINIDCADLDISDESLKSILI